MKSNWKDLNCWKRSTTIICSKHFKRNNYSSVCAMYRASDDSLMPCGLLCKTCLIWWILLADWLQLKPHWSIQTSCTSNLQGFKESSDSQYFSVIWKEYLDGYIHTGAKEKNADVKRSKIRNKFNKLILFSNHYFSFSCTFSILYRI